MAPDDFPGEKMTRDAARWEILNHGEDWQEFVEENGDHPEYDRETVFDWLGY